MVTAVIRPPATLTATTSPRTTVTPAAIARPSIARPSPTVSRLPARRAWMAPRSAGARCANRVVELGTVEDIDGRRLHADRHAFRDDPLQPIGDLGIGGHEEVAATVHRERRSVGQQALSHRDAAVGQRHHRRLRPPVPVVGAGPVARERQRRPGIHEHGRRRPESRGDLPGRRDARDARTGDHDVRGPRHEADPPAGRTEGPVRRAAGRAPRSAARARRSRSSGPCRARGCRARR